MFEESVKLFSDSTGFQHPSPNLNDSTECDVLHLVVKKKPTLRKAFYQPTEFKLSTILDPPDDLDVQIDFEAFVTQSLKSRKHVQGKLSAELSNLGTELSGNDYVNLECNFGKVDRKRVNRPRLVQCLMDRRVNFNHDLVQQISQSSKKCFCIVIESAVLTEDVHISLAKGERVKHSTDFGLSGLCGPCAKLFPSQPQEFDLEAGVHSKNEAIKSMVIPKGTIVAYETSEIIIHENGSVQILLSTDLKGGIMIPVFEEL